MTDELRDFIRETEKRYGVKVAKTTHPMKPGAMIISVKKGQRKVEQVINRDNCEAEIRRALPAMAKSVC